MIGSDDSVWRGILAHLRLHHVGICRRWFDEIEVVGVERGLLRLRVREPIRRRYLERECADAFSEAGQQVTGMLMRVAFIGEDGQTDPLPEPTPHRQNDHAPSRLPITSPPTPISREAIAATEQLALNPDYTFENFVVGPENRLAVAAARAVADSPGESYNPLFLHARVGLGKTHLLQAICRQLLQRNPAAVIHYTSCEEFIHQFMESISEGQMSGFRHRFRDIDLLMIDDIHFLAQRERSQEEFFHTFNHLYQARKQIVLSCDAPPDQIPALEERLVSRFKWGMVAEIERPGYETRLAIVQKKAAIRGVAMPDDVISLIATRIDSNIRELEGAIVRMQMQATVERRPIDIRLARQVLGETGPFPRSRVAIGVIIETVAAHFDLRPSDLQSKRRHKSVSQPRQICMFLARKLTSHSLEEIGGYFGGRDHTTVMHAVRTTAARMEQDPDLACQIKGLESALISQKPS